MNAKSKNDETVTTKDSKGQVVPLNMRVREIMDPVMPELIPALPSNIKPEKFQAAFITAVVNNPDILKCKPSSIRSALMKCATDGLVPDGRKAAIVPFGVMATYVPMTGGMIDRAAQLGEALSFTAECVHENDTFSVNMADPSKTEHTFGTDVFAERGEIIGAYAIFRTKDGTAIHRELMSRAEIEKAREVSKMKNAGPWTKWYSEMCRKTVIRRGIKYVPISTELRVIVEREDEHVDFGMKNATPDDYNPLQEPPQTVEGTANELEEAIDAPDPVVIEPMNDDDRNELDWVLGEIKEMNTTEDLHGWQSSFGEVMAKMHPDTKGDVRKALKDRARKLEKDDE